MTGLRLACSRGGLLTRSHSPLRILRQMRGANFGLHLPHSYLRIAIQDQYFNPFLAEFRPPTGCFP